MKVHVALALLVTIASAANAQVLWEGNGDPPTVVTTPAKVVELAPPSAGLAVGVRSAPGTHSFSFIDQSNGAMKFQYNNKVRFFYQNGASLAEVMTMDSQGDLGVGVTDPQAKLDVDGDARIEGKVTAQEVEVTMNGWSDYVFDDDYDLMPLADVAYFIERNRHLPDVPNEAEVLEHGVQIGEMQAVLLRKIEELTLHMIRLDRENAELRASLLVDQPGAGE